MEQLETLRLDQDPYPIEYEPSFPTHVLVVTLFLYLFVFLIAIGLTNYQRRIVATIRH